MPTDDEIIEKYDLEGDGDLGIDVHEALKEARAATAKQIFKKLERILKRGSKVYDTVEHRVYYELTIEDENDYQELKKEFKVD